MYLFLLNFQLHGAEKTVLDVLRLKGFTTTVDLFDKIGWTANITSPGPWAVFALTDAGFNELKVKAPAWHNTFTTNLTITPGMMDNHVVKGLVPNSSIRPGESAMTLEGPIFFNSIDNGPVMLSNLNYF